MVDAFFLETLSKSSSPYTNTALLGGKKIAKRYFKVTVMMLLMTLFNPRSPCPSSLLIRKNASP